MGATRAIADIGSHWLDMAEFVTGLKITRVMAKFEIAYPVRKKPISQVETFARSKSDNYEPIKIQTEDAAVVLMEFDNGAIGSLVVSQIFAGKKNTCSLHIGGSGYALSWDSEHLNELSIGYRDQPNQALVKDASLMHKSAVGTVSYPGGHIEGFPDAFKQGFRQFYTSLSEEGEYDYAKLEDGLREMMLCEAIFNSAQSGEWISIE